MNRKIIISFLLLLFTVAAMESQSLYGSGISPENALVRVVFTDTKAELSLEVGSVVFSSEEKVQEFTISSDSAGNVFL